MAALSLASTALVAADNAEEAEQDLAQVERAITAIGSWLDDARSRQSEGEQALQAVELRLAASNQNVNRLRQQIAASQARVAELEARQSTLQEQRDSRRERLDQALRAAYMARSNSPLKMVLNQQDLSDSARLLHYARLFSSAQLDSIAEYEQTLADLARVQEELNAGLGALLTQQASLDQELATLAATRQDQATALAALSQEIASREGQLGALRQDREELQALIEEIRRAMAGISSFADVPPFANQRGSLPPPLTGSLVSRFGSAYGDGNLLRQGITIAAPEGSPVRAVHAGRVVFADWLRGAGLLVILDHGDGYMSLYGANQTLNSEAGQWVDVGDVLSTSGRPGSGDSPGLYFEIRRNGEPQNPAPWLQNGRGR